MKILYANLKLHCFYRLAPIPLRVRNLRWIQHRITSIYCDMSTFQQQDFINRNKSTSQSYFLLCCDSKLTLCDVEFVAVFVLVAHAIKTKIHNWKVWILSFLMLPPDDMDCFSLQIIEQLTFNFFHFAWFSHSVQKYNKKH